MTFQFHNVIPGLVYESSSVKIDFSNSKVVEGLDKFRGRLVLKKASLEPPGLPLEERYIKGLYALEEALDETGAEIWGIKGEITGPLTEAYSVEILPWRKKAFLDEEIFKIIVDATSEVAYWLANQLQKLTKRYVGKSGETILFLDEPLLPLCLKDSTDPKETMKSINPVLSRIRCKKGIHICDNPVTVIDDLLELDIDYLSFDARRYPASLEKTKIEKIQRYLEGGGGFAFGLTPNTPEELFGEENIYEIQRGRKDPASFVPEYRELADRLERMFSPLESRVDVVSLLEQSLITPQCGFRNFSIPNPETGEQLVKRLLIIQERAAGEIREKYKIH